MSSSKTYAMNDYYISHMKDHIKTIRLEKLKIKIKDYSFFDDDILSNKFLRTMSRAERLEQLKKKREEEKEQKEQEALEVLLSLETLLNEFYKRLLFVVGPVFEKTYILYTHPERVKLN